MRKLLPVFLALLGLVAGVAGGYFLRPSQADPGPDAISGEPGDVAREVAPRQSLPARDYVKFNNQFVVPVMESGRVASLVILTLSLEIKPGGSERIYSLEPKLRDALLQALFNHANIGGFTGAFTEASNMDILRKALLEYALKIAGDTVSDVLISDIVRQDNS